MRLLSLFTGTALLVGCGGGQPAIVYRPDPARIDAMVAGLDEQEAIGQLKLERRRLAEKVEREWGAREDLRRRNEGELAYTEKLLDERLTALADRLIAQARQAPFAVVQRVDRFLAVEKDDIPQKHLDRIRSATEPAAAIHDKRSKELSDAYPLAKRFHTARAMLLRARGDLPLDAKLTAGVKTSLRVKVTGVPCLDVSVELNKLQSPTFNARTADLTFTITKCKLDLIEESKTENLEWDEEIQIGREWVVTRAEKVCGKARISAGSETCRREGDAAVCTKNTYEVEGGCSMVPVDGYWKPIMQTHHKRGSRVAKIHTYDFDVKATWIATYQGKQVTGTLAFDHYAVLRNAPQLGTHKEERATIRDVYLVVGEKLGTRPIEVTYQVNQLYGDEDSAARARAADTGSAGNLDAAEEAECNIVLHGGDISPALAERYGVTKYDVAATFRWGVKNGRTNLDDAMR